MADAARLAPRGAVVRRRSGRVRDVGAHAVQVDEVRDVDVVEVVRAGAAVAVTVAVAVGVGAAAAAAFLLGGRLAEEADGGSAQAAVGARALADGEADELAEDGELELELDGVDDALDEGLEDVEGGALDAEQAEVHGDDDDVDGDELVHGALGVGLEGGAEDLARFDDVDAGQDDFLHEEAGHLDFLHYIIAADENVGSGVAVRAERQNGGGNVEEDCIANNHPFRPVEDAVTALSGDNQMQA